MKRSLIIAVVISQIVMGCGQTDTGEPEFFGSNFSISSCIQHAGNGDALWSFMENKMKINELSPDMAKHFLGSSEGKAWSMTSPDGSYAVTYKEDGVCTVFIKETNVQRYIKHMNENIEHISSKTDWKFSTNAIPMFAGEEKLQAYEFSVKLPNKNIKIVISAVNKVTGNYQVAFSTILM